MQRCLPIVCGILSICLAVSAEPVVQVEELITRYEPADNGAGPLWCYGAPLIARDAGHVYLSIIETGRDVPPLCNTRWQLWHRDQSGWKLEQSEKDYRQREPCPIGLLPGGPLFFSVNPSTRPPGTHYGPCRPTVLQFDIAEPSAEPTELPPAWSEGTDFTDHSYRGFAVDGPGRELLAVNSHSKTGDQFISFRDRSGKWHPRGAVHFPIRSCYPQVGLCNRAAHIMAIGDIVEPNEEWRKLKKDVLQSDWDYVFRRLFYTWTADVMAEPFAQPLEIDTVEATGGHIANCDLHADASGVCHLLYVKRPHQYEFLRDKYFPGAPMKSHLLHVTVRKGRVLSRRVLAETPSGENGIEPAFARFHVAADGQLHVILAGTPIENGQRGVFANFIAAAGGRRPPRWNRLSLEHPLRVFFTNTPRGGSAPSDTIDLFGIANDSPNLRYARVQMARAATQPPS